MGLAWSTCTGTGTQVWEADLGPSMHARVVRGWWPKAKVGIPSAFFMLCLGIYDGHGPQAPKL